MTQPIRLALPANECLPQLKAQFGACGLDLQALDETVVLELPDIIEAPLEVLLLPDADVGTYVERGVVQAGVVSTHLLHERDFDVWRPYTFEFGRYPIVLASRRGQTLASLTARPLLRLATPIPKFTREWFVARGFNIEVIPVDSSPRKAVILGLADGFVDRLVSAEDLTNFDFHALERMGKTSLKLVVNSALSAASRKAIQSLILKLEEQRPHDVPEVSIPFDIEDAV